jgi:hypothetical protein
MVGSLWVNYTGHRPLFDVCLIHTMFRQISLLPSSGKGSVLMCDIPF